ncbi:MAG: hypothetical protein HC915_08070 [Anaerolineae bacterium]|nr:hypothetical protein [Anaerolineae bacterium]
MSQPPELLQTIESAVEAMLAAFDVDRPPVPVELMLQRPREGLWPEIDLAEMSATFLHLHDRYAPRMSVVRLLARNVARSPWGYAHGLASLADDSEQVNAFARAIILPQRFLDAPTPADLAALSDRFEVPENDVLMRLDDLGYAEG